MCPLLDWDQLLLNIQFLVPGKDVYFERLHFSIDGPHYKV